MTDPTDLARRLLGPAYEVRAVVPLGAGTDHVAYEVDGVLVVRSRRPVDGVDLAMAVRREVDLLDLVGRVSPIPVPEVVAAVPEDGLLAVRKLPGNSLLDQPSGDPAALVDQLAAFLAAIHGVPRDRVAGLVEEDEYPPGEQLAETAATLPDIAGLLGPANRRAVEEFLVTPPPAGPDALVFCHNDLGVEHLLAGPDRRRLTGVLDWSDAALADPAHDLGRLYRDLGPAVAVGLAERLGMGQDVLDRAAFHARCALVEDLAFGAATGDRRYVDAALGNLARTFRD